MERALQSHSNIKQFSTFYVGDRWYGIDVMEVQEVLKTLPMTKVPLAPEFVEGLINLRGQIATAIDLRRLFILESDGNAPQINVVCNHEDTLLSLRVDKIGDVVDAPDSAFENTPDTLDSDIKRFMCGVYKLDGPLLSIIEIDKIVQYLNKQVGKCLEGQK